MLISDKVYKYYSILSRKRGSKKTSIPDSKGALQVYDSKLRVKK